MNKERSQNNDQKFVNLAENKPVATTVKKSVDIRHWYDEDKVMFYNNS